MPQRIQLRRDVAADWTSTDPTLAAGEIGLETDTNRLKIGDGATAWSSLSYFGGLTSISAANFAGLPASGDYTNQIAYVRASQGSAWLPATLGGTYYPAGWYIWTGSAWVSDRNAIANAINDGLSGGGSSTVDVVSNVATDRILGRVTASSGDSEELTASQVRTLLNIEDGATADQSAGEIKTAYESNADTNAFTDAEQSKLSGIEAEATADQAWGDITGTLSNQTDLDTALGLKADDNAVVKLTGNQTIAGQKIIDDIIINTVTTLTSSSGAIAWVGNESNFYEITLTEDSTLNNPSGAVDNAVYTFRIKQDGTGLHTLAFGSNWKFPGGNAPSVTLDPNSVDYLTVIVEGTNLHAVEVQNFL